jgi:hypothetical protein
MHATPSLIFFYKITRVRQQTVEVSGDESLLNNISTYGASSAFGDFG